MVKLREKGVKEWKVERTRRFVDSRYAYILVRMKVVVNLTNSTRIKSIFQYSFRVIARNSVGDSSPTKTKGTCVTPPQLPDRNPSDVSILHFFPLHHTSVITVANVLLVLNI